MFFVFLDIERRCVVHVQIAFWVAVDPQQAVILHTAVVSKTLGLAPVSIRS